MHLAHELLIATAMVGLTMTLHLAGLALLLMLLRRHQRARPNRLSLLHEAAAILLAAAGLFVLHAVEIWAYAGFYLAVGAFGALEPALYFSTSSYTTVGYGDLVLAQGWRVVGAIESANGIILLGWSTAFFVGIVRRIRWLEDAFEDHQDLAR